MAAAERDFVDITHALLMHKACANARSSTGHTALAAAAAPGPHIASTAHGAVRALLLARADPAAKDQAGFSTADLADQRGSCDAAHLIRAAMGRPAVHARLPDACLPRAPPRTSRSDSFFPDFICWILRHGAQSIGIGIGNDGFSHTKDLYAAVKMRAQGATEDDI